MTTDAFPTAPAGGLTSPTYPSPLLGGASRDDEPSDPPEADADEPRRRSTTPERAATERLPAVESSWLAHLLAVGGSWSEIGARGLTGLALTSCFGLALGARSGVADMFASAAGVALAPAIVFALGVPALYIVLAVFDAPIEGRDLAGCASRGVAGLGITLAGLAPLTLLYVTTAGDGLWAALTAVTALVVGGSFALAQFVCALRVHLSDLTFEARAPTLAAAAAFCFLATVAACRIWFGVLPILGGGR